MVDWGIGASHLKKMPCLLVLVPSLLCADAVYVKGGAKFSGRIVNQTETVVTMDIGEGEVGIPRDRIEKIVHGTSPLQEYEDRAAKLQPNDANGWRDLGRWASEQGLARQAETAWKRVLTIDPNDLEARSGLGYVEINGRWATEEDSYRLQGFVKYQGEWMMPAEVQLIQQAEAQTAAAEQARYEAEERADQAEMDRQDAEWREKEAAKAAEEAQREQFGWDNPTVWGYGYGGYGVGYWPYTASVTRWPANRPANLPANRPARPVTPPVRKP